MFGSRVRLSKCITEKFNADGCDIMASNCVKYLGANPDFQLQFKEHVVAKCRKAQSSFFMIRNIRKFLNNEACEILVLALGMSHLDYTNSILHGLPSMTLNQYQKSPEHAGKISFEQGKFSSSKEALIALHWLPIKQQIVHKILCLVHKCLHGQAPLYLQTLIQKHVPKRNLRSSMNHHKLLIPTTKCKTFADRSFSVAGPKEWNVLPLKLRSTSNHEMFRKKLKTHLFINTSFLLTFKLVERLKFS